MMNNISASIPVPGISLSDFLVSEDPEEFAYSCWQSLSDGYLPSIELKLCNKLPSGCYKLEFDNKYNDYKAAPIDISSDEAYRFSESYTEEILKEVNDFWNKEDTYKKYGLTHKRGLLLEGPAGNGKSVIITLLIQDILKQDGLVFIVNNEREMNILFGALPTCIKKIEPNRKIIIVIEDIDKIIESIGSDASILDFLDGKTSLNHQLVIMTSNDTTSLSEALLRPSRIDMRFVIQLPNETIRREYLEKKGVPAEHLDSFAKKTEGLTFAQLKEVFVGTIVLEKNIDDVIMQIKNPLATKDYLNKTNNISL